jgi:hypothetical protein
VRVGWEGGRRATAGGRGLRHRRGACLRGPSARDGGILWRLPNRDEPVGKLLLSHSYMGLKFGWGYAKPHVFSILVDGQLF